MRNQMRIWGIPVDIVDRKKALDISKELINREGLDMIVTPNSEIIMNVRMIGISYDPKINSFLNSIGLKALSTTIDFNSEYFIEEYHRVVDPSYESTCARVRERVAGMVKSLGTNEEMIKKIMEGHSTNEKSNENMGNSR